MTHFELRIPSAERAHSAARDIELWVSLVPPGKRTPTWQRVHSYPPQEQYPLGTDRFATNRRNLFLDVLSLLDAGARVEDAAHALEVSELASMAESSGQTQVMDSEESTSVSSLTHASAYTVASLKTLAQRAARVAADGSGNARRFKDARALWQKLSEHVGESVRSGLREPVTDVRKTKNWKKNQPMKHVAAHPDAWYVLNVFTRSNPKKDPFVAVRSLDELWAFVASRDAEDATARETVMASVKQQRAAAQTNLDYPTFGELAQLTGDSNMLVFPDDVSFVSWIRATAGSSDELARETPVEAHVPATELDPEDPAYIPPVSTGTVLHLANVLERAAAL